MYVYKHTYIHTYTSTVTMEVYDMNFNVKSRCAQVRSNTAQANKILYVHYQLLYDYFNLKTKTSVTHVQVCHNTKIPTFK